MQKFYSISIRLINSQITHQKISEILKVTPLEFAGNKRIESEFTTWNYQVEEKEEGPYFDFINSFLDLLEPNFEALNRLGIEKDNITFWLLYEYDQQCGLEFNPQDMKRLGENGISLCIDCWQG